jgi:hypothetical protein
METVIHTIGDISSADRHALEHLVGRELGEDQQVIIKVVTAVTPQTAAQQEESSSEVPDWWKIYEGLSDDEIELLDKAIRQRANLTRSVA